MELSDFGSFVHCPFCSFHLQEGSEVYCNCIEGEIYYYLGAYYKVNVKSPWSVCTWYGVSGGPEVSRWYENEVKVPKIRFPNKWNSKTGRDDLRKSWGTKPGGLKNSLLRARGSFRN